MYIGLSSENTEVVREAERVIMGPTPIRKTFLSVHFGRKESSYV